MTDEICVQVTGFYFVLNRCVKERNGTEGCWGNRVSFLFNVCCIVTRAHLQHGKHREINSSAEKKRNEMKWKGKSVGVEVLCPGTKYSTFELLCANVVRHDYIHLCIAESELNARATYPVRCARFFKTMKFTIVAEQNDVFLYIFSWITQNSILTVEHDTRVCLVNWGNSLSYK